MFQEEDVAPASFNLICCFQTLEHALEPKLLVNAVYQLLVQLAYLFATAAGMNGLQKKR